MPRVNDIYQLPPGVYGVSSRPIESAKYNTTIDDVAADLNAARPITAGGTGATSKEGARAALDIPDGATFIKKAGDRMTGSLSSKVFGHGNKAIVTEIFKFVDGNTHTVTVAGNLIIDPQGLNEGDVMQINAFYQSGSISVSGTTLWELGQGGKSTSFGEVGVTLVANMPYRIIFEIVGGVRTGIFQ